MQTIAKLREIERQARVQARELADLKTAKQAEDDAKLSEQERLSRRVADLEGERAAWKAERRELLIRQAVERQARKLRLVDEDAAYRLMDLDALEFDESGLPTNVDAVLKALAKAKPYLVAPETTPAAGSTGANGTNGTNGTNAQAGIPGTPRPDNGRALADSERERLRLLTERRARAAFG
jgi:hypothetical protein